MSWLLLTVLAILSRAVLGVSQKVLSSNIKASPKTISVIFTGCATILVLIVSPFMGGISFQGINKLWLITIVMITSQAFGNVIYFKGIEALDSSTTQIAFSSILVWGTLLSIIFLGSNFNLKQIIGIFILLCAIILVQYHKQVRKMNTDILYIVAAAGLLAIFQVTSAELSKSISAGGYLLLAYLGSTLIIGIIYYNDVLSELPLLRTSLVKIGSTVLFTSFASLMYFIFSYFAYRTAPDSGVVVVLLTTQVIVAVILSIIFLKEKDSIGRKILAGILAVIAGFLIKS